MAGFYGIIKEKVSENNYYNFFTKEKNTQYNFIEVKNKYLFGRHVLTKLSSDRFFEDSDAYTICFEGVNYSKKLKNTKDFISAYEKQGINFIKEIDGLFSILIYDKKLEKIFLVTDHLASKSIYYTVFENSIAFASEVKVVNEIMNNLKLSKTLDTDGVYLLSLYGTLQSNLTIVKEIKRLEQGRILSFDIKNNKVSIEKWYSYAPKIKKTKLNDAIEAIDALMVSNIINEWNKDLEYKNEHLTSSSGGMDAKTNLLIAHKLGFTPISTVTFGNSDSLDVKIAEEISKKYNFNHVSIYLDNGKYLEEKDLYNIYMKAIDGQSLFNGAAHLNYSTRKLDLSNYSVYHSGQIGDLVLSSAIIKTENVLAKKQTLGYTGETSSAKILNKVTILDSLLEKYDDNLKLYYYEEKISSGTLMGDRSISNLIDIVSPFYNKDLISYTQTLPNDILNNGNLYFHWLKKKHPYVLEEKWERINMKPNAYYKFAHLKKVTKAIDLLKSKLGMSTKNMNPLALWINENENILKNLNHHFNTQLEISSIDITVKKDLNEIYNNNIPNYTNKFSVINTLYAINKIFK